MKRTSKHKKIKKFISDLNKIYGQQKESCYLFSRLLISVFGGELYYDSDHVITKINGVFYDSKGIVEDTDNYLPEAEFGTEHFEQSFKCDK